ncbi:acyl-CoA Delta-9 desaturase-like [Leptopilina boulardi]|uniref:acyl-CoA Delta-9 desaturase-like n=1 Tax=Leptopilina boulardi TaxID=63433 RepID=UPI0021F64790|nr:acyl-CoA Delta-9 desaturase-like [Leptopilina boulardi]
MTVSAEDNNKSLEYENETFLESLNRWRKNMLWSRFFMYTIWVSIALYGFLTFPYKTHKLTFIWLLIVHVYAAFGTCGGAHRYWAHRSFKANLPLRIFMAFGHYCAGNFSIYDWVKIHRVHHRYTDTDADPHTATRGFVFSHIGWWVQKKHPEFLKRLKECDMSDVKADPVVAFGDRHFGKFMTLMITLPALVPVYLWGETWYWSIMSQFFMRSMLTVNSIALVNSASHLFGSKPFDSSIMPSENYLVVLFSTGEGWHNYHHTFPWDYRAGGLGKYDFNLTSFFIKQFGNIGWAYDLKTASDDLIKLTCKNRGDGSYKKLWEEVPLPE